MAKVDPLLVLIAVDASSHSEKSIQWYIQKLHLPQNQVVLIHSIIPPLNAEQKHYVDPAIYEKLVNKEKEKMEPFEQKYMSMLQQKGIDCAFKMVLCDKPGEAIVEEANTRQAGMIVTGTRGLGTIRRTVIGSVSDYILHHAHCPVLICCGQ